MNELAIQLINLCTCRNFSVFNFYFKLELVLPKIRLCGICWWAVSLEALLSQIEGSFFPLKERISRLVAPLFKSISFYPKGAKRKAIPIGHLKIITIIWPLQEAEAAEWSRWRLVVMAALRGSALWKIVEQAASQTDRQTDWLTEKLLSTNSLQGTYLEHKNWFPIRVTSCYTSFERERERKAKIIIIMKQDFSVEEIRQLLGFGLCFTAVQARILDLRPPREANKSIYHRARSVKVSSNLNSGKTGNFRYI